MIRSDDTPANQQLIATKLQIPRPRDHVHRQRLTALLESAAVPLVIASAPAGSGKTTALVDWLVRSERPVAWYSLDRHDDDPLVFFAYVAAALQPLIGPGRLSGLMAAPAEDTLNPRLLSSAFLEDLNGAPDGTVLVLEDLHVITNPTIQSVLRDSIPHVESGITVAIGTRSDPSLPLARLRAQGDLIELRVADLAFQPDESKRLLVQMPGVELSDAAIERLNGRVEGWAVGLQLAGLSVANRSDAEEFIDNFTGDSRYVADYLLDEVLSLQTEEVQSFLLDTSVLGRLSTGLCGAVTGNPDAGAILLDLYQRNIFVVALDDHGAWFRYHHLFADLLRGRLEESHPGRSRELMRAGAKWSEAEGEIEDALRYAISSGDLEGAEATWEKHAELLLPQGQIGRLISWLRLFPPERVETKGELLLGRAWANLFTLRSEQALADLERAGTFDTSSFRFEVDGQLEIMKAMAHWDLGNLQACIDHARRGLELLPPTNRMLPSLGNLYLGRGELASGEIDDALRDLSSSAEQAWAGGNFFAGIAALLALAAAQFQSGDLDAAAEHYRTALRLSEDAAAGGRDFPARGAAHVGLGVVSFERYELANAVEEFRRGLFDLKRTVYLDYTVLGFRRWSETESLRGNHEEAAEVLEEARAHLSQFGGVGSPLVRSLADCEVRNLLRKGDVELAAGRLAAIHPTDAHQPAELANSAFDHLGTVIRLKLDEDSNTVSVSEAKRLSGLAGGNRGLLAKALVLETCVHQALGDLTAASATLGEAVVVARPGRWIRPFVDAGPSIASLLADPDLGEKAPELIAEILELIPKKSPPGSIAQPLIDPLTKRELEVLDEIAAGRTNAEIGDRLFISVGTVKRHVANVFLKLGAGHRAEAVAKARALGMFD
jgi:LuxR family maltose regulon positive regulatory protein